MAPRVAAGRARVLSLAGRARRYLSALAGANIPRVDASRLEIVHDVYAGAYGRALPAAERGAALLRAATGVRLDDTYSAKGFTAALEIAREESGTTLFWLTFDGRGA